MAKKPTIPITSYSREGGVATLQTPAAYRELLDRMGGKPPETIGGIWRACREAHTTDMFPQLLGTTIGKKVVEQFKSWSPVWPLLAGIDSVNKLGVSIPRVMLGEAGDLVLKAEGAPIRHDTMTDDQYTVSANTYASGYVFTREAILNDDTGLINQTIAKMARAAARTIDKRLGAVIRANGNAYDGIAFFYSTHSNTVTTLLSRDLVGANLIAAAARAIRSQKDIDSRQYLGIKPDRAFSSITLFETLSTLCTSPTIEGPTVASPTYSASNPAKQYGLTPIEFPDLGDTNDWYVIADPAINPAFVVSFYNGDMTPKILQKKSLYEIQGGSDTWDAPACDLEYDVVMDFQVTMADWRAAYGGIVAGGT